MLDWSGLTLRLGALGRVRCEPGWTLAPSWSANLRDFDLWMVWSGRGRMTLRDRTVDLHAGVCLWARPGGLYHAEQDPDDRLVVNFMHFDLLDASGRRLAEAPEDWPLPPEYQVLADLGYFDTVMRRVVELVGRWPRGQVMPRARAEPIATTLTLALLREYEAAAEQGAARQAQAGTPRRHRDLVLALASGISENPQQALTVAQMARQCGYSADHFARVFRAVLGQSPQDFVVAARLNRARQLLRESSLSVSQIADVLGYQDVFFFSRQFKQKVGRTPTQYRRHQPGRTA